MARVLSILLLLTPALFAAGQSASGEATTAVAKPVWATIPEPEILALMAVSVGVIYLRRKAVRR